MSLLNLWGAIMVRNTITATRGNVSVRRTFDASGSVVEAVVMQNGGAVFLDAETLSLINSLMLEVLDD